MISRETVAMFSLTALIFLVQPVAVDGVPNVQLLFYSCGTERGYSTAFAEVRDTLNYYIVQHTYSFYGNMYRQAEGGDITLYGHGSCSARISEDDCAGCLEGIRQFLLTNCPRNMVAICQVVDCKLRYSVNPFDSDE